MFLWIVPSPFSSIAANMFLRSSSPSAGRLRPSLQQSVFLLLSFCNFWVGCDYGGVWQNYIWQPQLIMYHEWKLKLNISLFRRLREDIDEGDKLTLIHFSIPALLTFLTEDDKGMSISHCFFSHFHNWLIPLSKLIMSTCRHPQPGKPSSGGNKAPCAPLNHLCFRPEFDLMAF